MRYEEAAGLSDERLTWVLISLTATLFFIADVGIYLPSVSGMNVVARVALLAAVGAITLSRIFLVWGLWRMARVYRARRAGFPIVRSRLWGNGVPRGTQPIDAHIWCELGAVPAL